MLTNRKTAPFYPLCWGYRQCNLILTLRINSESESHFLIITSFINICNIARANLWSSTRGNYLQKKIEVIAKLVGWSNQAGPLSWVIIEREKEKKTTDNWHNFKITSNTTDISSPVAKPAPQLTSPNHPKHWGIDASRMFSS